MRSCCPLDLPTLLKSRFRVALRFVRGASVGLLLLSSSGRAQANAQPSGQPAERPVTSGTMDATRAELTTRLDSLQRATGGGRSAKDRDREIAELRTRLTDGDIRTGDRFLIDFGAGERRADTVLVRENVEVTLLNWSPFSLRGVLLSELQPAMERYVGTYVREPRVRVYPLTRVSITGAVARPGFYNVDPTRQLSDAIANAGGPTSSGQYDKITIKRGATRVYDEKAVTKSLREGATVEDIGLRSGDEIHVAEKKNRRWAPSAQSIFIGLTAFGTILALIRASYAE